MIYVFPGTIQNVGILSGWEALNPHARGWERATLTEYPRRTACLVSWASPIEKSLKVLAGQRAVGLKRLGDRAITVHQSPPLSGEERGTAGLKGQKTRKKGGISPPMTDLRLKVSSYQGTAQNEWELIAIVRSLSTNHKIIIKPKLFRMNSMTGGRKRGFKKYPL